VGVGIRLLVGNTLLVDEDRQLQEGTLHRPPSEVTADRGLFDRFAAWASHLVSRGPFFLVCALGIGAWALGGVFVGFSDRWLAWGAIGMATVILLLVAVLENAQRRSDQALQRKLNAMADALADFMCGTHIDDRRVEELRSAVGLEHRESTDDTHVDPVFRRPSRHQ
jgi:low affinity Fe/Cu permease